MVKRFVEEAERFASCITFKSKNGIWVIESCTQLWNSEEYNCILVRVLGESWLTTRGRFQIFDLLPKQLKELYLQLDPLVQM